jgi:hypothetical protein
MRKVVSYLILYKFIFYLAFFEDEKSLFWFNQFKSIWIFLNNTKIVLFTSGRPRSQPRHVVHALTSPRHPWCMPLAPCPLTTRSSGLEPRAPRCQPPLSLSREPDQTLHFPPISLSLLWSRLTTPFPTELSPHELPTTPRPPVAPLSAQIASPNTPYRLSPSSANRATPLCQNSSKRHRHSPSTMMWQNHLKNEGFVARDHIRGFSMKREYANTTHTSIQIPYMKFKLRLLHIKCHVLEFIKDEAQNIAS